MKSNSDSQSSHGYRVFKLWDLIGFFLMAKTAIIKATKSSATSRGDKDSIQNVSSTSIPNFDTNNLNSSFQLTIHKLNDKN